MRNLRAMGLPGVAIVLLLTVAGCDPGTGVRRTVRVEYRPSPQLIERAIRAVPEIDDVRYQSAPASTRWSLFGPIRNPASDQFHYSAGPVGGALRIEETHTGEITLDLSYMTVGRGLSREYANQVRALMDKVYSSLRTHLPDLPPESEVKEELIRIADE